MLREFQEITKLKNKQEKLKSQLKLEQSGRRSNVVAAYITFETKEQRDDAYFHFHKSPFSSLAYAFFGCCYRKSANIFHDTYLKIRNAPSPNNILWANLDYDITEKFFRRLVSWLITVGFWAISMNLKDIDKY